MTGEQQQKHIAVEVEAGKSEVFIAAETGPFTGQPSLGNAKFLSASTASKILLMEAASARGSLSPGSPMKVDRILLFVLSITDSGIPIRATWS
eukprot:CAMPEP_0115164050 /NCGR_PEP_ID=MMETSP0227-20121206/72828_1 /TAXON_ID=89957 /ORGANISM="Polarella glacialis, Strain CCMP 1383" /LENGTH=92 /DNA_ID=CAMNT_0002576381 /DNA_START=683 /DNA_END=962 /DNA_ORIENTATION=+